MTRSFLDGDQQVVLRYDCDFDTARHEGKSSSCRKRKGGLDDCRKFMEITTLTPDPTSAAIVPEDPQTDSTGCVGGDEQPTGLRDFPSPTTGPCSVATDITSDSEWSNHFRWCPSTMKSVEPMSRLSLPFLSFTHLDPTNELKNLTHRVDVVPIYFGSDLPSITYFHDSYPGPTTGGGPIRQDTRMFWTLTSSQTKDTTSTSFVMTSCGPTRRPSETPDVHIPPSDARPS